MIFSLRRLARGLVWAEPPPPRTQSLGGGQQRERPRPAAGLGNSRCDSRPLVRYPEIAQPGGSCRDEFSEAKTDPAAPKHVSLSCRALTLGKLRNLTPVRFRVFYHHLKRGAVDFPLAQPRHWCLRRAQATPQGGQAKGGGVSPGPGWRAAAGNGGLSPRRPLAARPEIEGTRPGAEHSEQQPSANPPGRHTEVIAPRSLDRSDLDLATHYPSFSEAVKCYHQDAPKRNTKHINQ